MLLYIQYWMEPWLVLLILWNIIIYVTDILKTFESIWYICVVILDTYQGIMCKLIFKKSYQSYTLCEYSTSQKFGHTYSFKGFSLFELFCTLQNSSEDIKTMKLHIWNHVVTKKSISTVQRRLWESRLHGRIAAKKPLQK